MKNVIIGSVVAAFIVFFFQGISWMVLPIHKHSFKYTPQQNAALSALTENLPADGMYALPTLDPDTATPEQMEEFNKSMEGKPWAVVQYHKSYNGMMTERLVCGFLLDLLSALVVGHIMWTTREKFLGVGPKLGLVLAVVTFMILQDTLMQANWMETPWHFLSGTVLDHIIGWTLGGTWLAWFIGKKQTA